MMLDVSGKQKTQTHAKSSCSGVLPGAELQPHPRVCGGHAVPCPLSSIPRSRPRRPDRLREAPAPRITSVAPRLGLHSCPPAGRPHQQQLHKSMWPPVLSHLPFPHTPSTACTTINMIMGISNHLQKYKSGPYFPRTAPSPASTSTTRQLIPRHSSTFLVSLFWSKELDYLFNMLEDF